MSIVSTESEMETRTSRTALNELPVSTSIEPTLLSKETEESTTASNDSPISTSSPSTLLSKMKSNFPTPNRLKWDNENPNAHEFTLFLNIVFGAASTFTVANLYYVQPLLIVLARDFDVSYESVTNIPSLLQAGYSVGLLFITPLGDLIPRRPLLLLLVAACSFLTLALALVKDVKVWEVLSFFLGLFSVTPQVLLPLAGDLAKPEKRAAALSVVLAGLLLGLLFGRAIAGVIAEVGNVAEVYFMSCGLQIITWILLYFTVPDYPAKNKNLTYFHILYSMAKYAVTEPILIQHCLIGMASSAIFATFWLTSTFLLGEVFGFNSLQIGCMALIGFIGVGTAPYVGKLVDSFVPWFGTLVGISIIVVSQIIYVSAAGSSVAAVAVVIFILDVGQQYQQLSNSSRIFAINAAARARLSAVYIFSIFIGQLIGTSVGTRVYLKYGYRGSGVFCLGLLVYMFFILALRGPHSTDWFGWKGGYSMRKAPPIVKVIDEETIIAEDLSVEKVEKSV